MKEDIPTNPSEAQETRSNQWPIRVRKKFWNSEKIVSLSAFVVSIATLLALMYQIRLSGEQNELARRQQELIRKQQYASVLPYLELRIGTNNGNRLFEFILYNNGVGPAFIEEIRTVYNGQVYLGPPFEFYRAVIMRESKDTIPLGVSNVIKGQVVPAEKEIAMLTAYSYSASPEDRDQLLKWFGRTNEELASARVEVVYSSVYGERWVIKGIGAIPESLPSEEVE